MSSKAIADYYDSSSGRETREDLRFAVESLGKPGLAIDCGCGAGSDIAYLREKGFIVHAFDIESEAIARCRRRFADDAGVVLARDSFSSFDYPVASLVVADASLFFCPPDEFDEAWHRMTTALEPGGIFAGSFLGPEDTMAGAGFDREAFWPEVLVLTEEQVRYRMEGFEILRWTEHRIKGETAQGVPHQWHIFAVVARKRRLVDGDGHS